MKSKTTIVLWIVYLALLAVLLPHTANIFTFFEPVGGLGGFSSWSLAFAFEAAIAGLTYKLSERIEYKPKGKHGFSLFTYRYVNIFSVGLIFATAVSALANLAHAVQYGKPLLIFAEWGIPSAVYSLAFGGILPLVSLTFAGVLSNVTDDEDAPNPELEKARADLTEAKGKLRDSERQRIAAEDRAGLAEERAGTALDLAKYLFGEDKRQRILFARQTWAKLPNSAIAVIAESSPSYVSEVLNSGEAIDVTAEYAQAGKQ